MKKPWFEGTNEIQSNIQKVKKSLENLGEHFVGIVSLMPGLINVELVEQGSNFVTIKTNEGLMKRKNITKKIDSSNIQVEFDEEYQAKKKITTNSHFLHEFTTSSTGVNHHIVISEVEAPGILGSLYRTFGSSKIGKAFLKSYKTYLEQ